MSLAPTATDRVYNFSPGPAALPLSVLERAQRELLCLPGAGASVLEISHRDQEFLDILASAQSNLRKLLGIPESYKIIFLQGGSRLQFSMIPMNLARGAAKGPEYLVTGSWSKSALAEAQREGATRVLWDGKATNYDRLPKDRELQFDPDAAYLYFCSNETIQGVQYGAEPPPTKAPVVCDASSDFLSRPLPVDRYGLLYACAQKNAGPAGVTVVILRDNLVERSADSLPGYLNFREHVQNDSLYNTPPTFAIYLLNLVTEWLLDEIGGLDRMLALNQRKAAMLYDVIDESNSFYSGHAQADCRSLMNVTFRLPNDGLQKEFLSGAEQRRLCSLKGHRSVGGIRASIYNAMPMEGVETLRDYMREFAQRHG